MSASRFKSTPKGFVLRLERGFTLSLHRPKSPGFMVCNQWWACICRPDGTVLRDTHSPAPYPPPKRARRLSDRAAKAWARQWAEGMTLPS